MRYGKNGVRHMGEMGHSPHILFFRCALGSDCADCNVRYEEIDATEEESCL